MLWNAAPHGDRLDESQQLILVTESQAPQTMHLDQARIKLLRAAIHQLVPDPLQICQAGHPLVPCPAVLEDPSLPLCNVHVQARPVRFL